LRLAALMETRGGRLGGGEAERERRRELLQALGFLGAAGLRRQPFGQAREHGEHRRGNRPVNLNLG